MNMCYRMVLALVGFASCVPANLSAQAPASTAAPEAVLINFSGAVSYQKSGTLEWAPAQQGQVLKPGDVIKTGPNSRAKLQSTDNSLWHIAPNSLHTNGAPKMQGAPPTPKLQSGRFFGLFRDAKEHRFESEKVSGAIRGTELHILVEPTGRTVVSLMDGLVDLTNEFGQLRIASGEEAVVEPGQAPVKTARLWSDQVNQLIQWCLYYPGILNLPDLGWDEGAQADLQASLAAYRAGDLLQALAAYPENRQPTTAEEKAYRAALLLAVGNVEEAEKQLNEAANQGERAAKLAAALRRLMAAVKRQTGAPNVTPTLATEWLAESYYQQSQSRLNAALEAAKAAAKAAPEFGFAWIQVAELEFSFGRTHAALDALEHGLRLSPKHPQGHALKGFLLSAQGRWHDALAAFDKAIELDGSLGNAWLGHGLVRIRQGQIAAGRRELLIAAGLEPQRAILRSYLGKAFSLTGDQLHASKELALAQKLDPSDPTAFLYSALLHQRNNQINAAVRDLEHSQDLNNNRSVYRSQLLLDQDRAVRSANLAAIYRDAGMTEVSVREAARAVQSDYANYSAHLFLANSYSDLLEVHGVNLRYETPAVAEFLIANLLAPPGAGTLSRQISQQEYSRFFEQNRLGFNSTTDYRSQGAWQQTATQYGDLGRVSYAVDTLYRTDNGFRPNQDLYQFNLSAQFKLQLTPKDSFYFQSVYAESEAGDLIQYYNQASANTRVRLKEKQNPLLFAGLHHEWSPGVHTLLLAGRLKDDLRQTDPAQTPLIGTATPAAFTPLGFGANSFDYRSRFEIYSAEFQQLWQQHNHGLVLGARGQFGDFDTRSRQFNPTVVPFLWPSGTVADQNYNNDFSRVTVYGYYNWQIWEPLLLTAGLSYDQVHQPVNFRNSPINNDEETRRQVSPKAGLIWTPGKNTTLRAAYTRSLGGVSFDQSIRLEPTQVAGFNQAYRSLLPESIAGAAAAPKFEIGSLGLEQKFARGTYLGVEADWLRSQIAQTLGAFAAKFIPPSAAPYDIREHLRYEEKALTFYASQLLADEWSLGARYRLGDARLLDRFDQLAGSPAHSEATLQQLNLYALFNHRCGFFARAESLWFSQSNRGARNSMPGDDFWQLNTYLGYRFPRRAAELQLGLLNLTGRDYQLDPLNLYAELPRERTVILSLKFNF